MNELAALALVIVRRPPIWSDVLPVPARTGGASTQKAPGVGPGAEACGMRLLRITRQARPRSQSG